MAIEIIRRAEQRSSSWSGGTTTQLAIFPPDASYRHRNFLFRLSTATTEAEQSEFTSLPGVTRHIMLLNGALVLQHEGHHTKTLSVFETDTFDGGWITKSQGKATDFNLMTKGNTEGTVGYLRLENGAVQHFDPLQTGEYRALYLFRGQADATVTPDDFRITAREGDLILLSPGNSNQAIRLTALEQSDLIVAGIRMVHLSYHHIGIPTLEPKEGEAYLASHKIYHSGFETSKYGIEWMRYEEGCTMPEIVRTIPHVAFEVNDIYEAVKGKKVLIEPNSPSEGVIVALIEENGAPVEMLQYVNRIEN
jgi:environmental stress-induced protein Ves